MRRPAPDTFTLACLDYNETMLEKSLYFRPRQDLSHTDWVGVRRSYTLEKLHTPEDPQKDPFLVALIIALAQNDRRHAAQPLPRDSSFTVGHFLHFFRVKTTDQPRGCLPDSHPVHREGKAKANESLRSPCASFLP